MRILFIVVVCICLIFAAKANAASIIGSYHDLSYLYDLHDSFYGNTFDPPFNNYNEVCVYCHTPHNAAQSVPLWNKANIGTSYTPYFSESMSSAPGQPSAISLLCLSCHDGTTALDAVVNVGSSLPEYSSRHGKMVPGEPYQSHTDCASCHNGYDFIDLSGSYITTDLSNDHPVSMAYPSSAEYKTPMPNGEFVGGVKLIDGKVECASCHDVHDPANKPFLRTSNSGSQLCLTCHIK